MKSLFQSIFFSLKKKESFVINSLKYVQKEWFPVHHHDHEFNYYECLLLFILDQYLIYHESDWTDLSNHSAESFLIFQKFNTAHFTLPFYFSQVSLVENSYFKTIRRIISSNSMFRSFIKISASTQKCAKTM